MKGVRIRKLQKLGEHERGATYLWNADRQGQCMLGYRKAGTVNGNHYHKGHSEQKKPEVLILFEGKAIIRSRNLETGEESEDVAQSPCRVEIDPMVWHELEAVTAIGFLELNALEEHQKDTFYDAG